MTKTNPRAEPRAPLTREQVIHAAVRLADEEGVASLSMRKLAGRLGVKAMSLYHYVTNKDEVLDGIVDAVFSEIALPSSEEDWRAAMRRRALSARAALLRHRWAVGLLDSRVNTGPATLRHHDAVIGRLREAGFSVASTARAFSITDSYIYGFVLQELSLPFSTSEELEEVAETILQRMPASAYPHITELMVEHALQPGYAYVDEFEFGLELILDGLERVRGK